VSCSELHCVAKNSPWRGSVSTCVRVCVCCLHSSVPGSCGVLFCIQWCADTVQKVNISVYICNI